MLTCLPDKMRFALVDGALGFFTGKGVDQPFHLPPVTVFEDVLRPAALLGAHRRLQRRLLAELVHQLLGIRDTVAAGDEEVVHLLRITGERLQRRA
jgi:hypothetical protein